MQRLTWPDRLRGLAILSVVIQHLTNNFDGDYVFHKWIGIANMGVFFFVSGYIAAYKERDELKTWIGAAKYLWHKTLQLMLPFLVWGLVVNRYFFTTDWNIITFTDVMDEWKRPHLWFLLTLYAHFILLTMERLTVGKCKSGGVKISYWIIALMGMFGFNKYVTDVHLATMYLLPFAMGLATKRITKIETLMTNPYIITMAFIVIFFCLDWWISGAGNMKNNMLKLAVSFSTIIVLYNICKRIDWNKHVDLYIRRCGVYSLAIYCTHWSFINVSQPSLFHFTNNELVAFVLAALFSVFIIEACVLFKRVVAFSPTLDLLLFGNRK